MTATHQAVDGVDYEELAARFRPIFDRIAEGAARRENERTIAYEEVGWLRDAGFGAVRVPVEYGGSGATVTQLFRLLNDFPSELVPVHIVYPSRRNLAPRTRVVMDFLVEQMRQISSLVADGAEVLT